MAKYTIEDFENWLEADSNRKRGLWMWNQVINKVKSDPDLFASLSTGIDQGGWNLSDPKFRKEYRFEDYYQVFLQWKVEVDAQETNNSEDNNESEENHSPYYYLFTRLKNNQIKYSFCNSDSQQLTYQDFINLLKAKDKNFFLVFQETLNHATSKLSAYFLKCPPVSKKTLNKPFEFVAIKSKELNNMTQDFESFNNYLSRANRNPVYSFPSRSGDATLIIPSRKVNNEGEVLDYKNISQFTKNAPQEQQQELWQEVSNKLMEELKKNATTPCWLNTHGLGVRYLHVRIDKSNKYYSDYEEYREEKKWLNINKNSKETKVDTKRVIKEIQSKKLIDCETLNQLKPLKLSVTHSELNSEERKKLSQHVVENLKKNQEGWNIKEITTIDYFGREDYQSNELLVIHKSAQLKYDNGILIFDRKTMWEKDFFTNQQWQELEQIIPFSTEKQSKSNDLWPKIKTPLITVSLILGVGLIVYLIYRWVRRNTKG